MTSRFFTSAMAAIILSASNGLAQDDEIEAIESLDDQEQELPAMPRLRGPITVMKPAALLFATFDKNGDYAIDRLEAESGYENAFLRADRDGNKSLTLFELEDWREKALGSLDANPGNLNFDTDFDNRVSRSEFASALADLFDRHDDNDDGQIENSELMQILEVPRRKEPEKEKMTDRQCYEQINRGRF